MEPSRLTHSPTAEAARPPADPAAPSPPEAPRPAPPEPLEALLRELAAANRSLARLEGVARGLFALGVCAVLLLAGVLARLWER